MCVHIRKPWCVIPIYDFSFVPRQDRTAGQVAEPNPSIPQKIPGAPDLSQDTTITFDPINTNTPEDINAKMLDGFHAVDDGVKKYFDKMIFPTKDGNSQLTARVAGGDKTYLFWKQDLSSNRIKLPVMSINRTSWKWDANRFSPPYLEVGRRFVHKAGNRLALIFRPWPCLVEYTFSLWGERKRDLEYIAYDISTRFNPLAEIMIEFSTLKGNIRGKLNDVSDNSDIDIGADELAKVRYDINTTWEAWLPLPEKVVPTILGRVGTLNEYNGQFLDVVEFNESGGINAVSLKDTSTVPIEE